MKEAIQHIEALIVDEEGATAIEYGLLAALIAGVIVSVVQTLGATVVGLYNTVSAAFP